MIDDMLRIVLCHLKDNSLPEDKVGVRGFRLVTDQLVI